MSRYFPQATYAEDQPYGKTILTLHVFLRAVPLGAAAGAAVFGLRSGVGSLLSSRTKSPAIPAAASSSPTQPSLKPPVPPPPQLPAAPLQARLLRATGTGAAATAALLAVALAGRMNGRDHVEWQDRSWRLLSNKGQVEVDDWTVGGMAAGAVAVAAFGRGLGSTGGGAGGLGVRGAVGGVGAGSLAGVVGYMLWRYGVKGGKWDD